MGCKKLKIDLKKLVRIIACKNDGEVVLEELP